LTGAKDKHIVVIDKLDYSTKIITIEVEKEVGKSKTLNA
jgi:hypothetical protein